MCLCFLNLSTLFFLADTDPLLSDLDTYVINNELSYAYQPHNETNPSIIKLSISYHEETPIFRINSNIKNFAYYPVHTPLTEGVLGFWGFGVL